MPETDLYNATVHLLRSLGLRAWRNNVIKGRMYGRWIEAGVVGSGDVEGWVPGRARKLAIELKSPDGQLEESQIEYRDLLLSDGGIYVEARTLQEVEDGVRRLID